MDGLKLEEFYCEGPGCMNKIPKPVYCCHSFDCGCRGEPIEPPFCSQKCYDEFTKGRGENGTLAFK